MERRTATHLSSFITKSYLGKQFHRVSSALTAFKTTPRFPWKGSELGSFKTVWRRWNILWDPDINLLDLDDFKSAYILQHDHNNGDIKDYVFHVFLSRHFAQVQKKRFYA